MMLVSYDDTRRHKAPPGWRLANLPLSLPHCEVWILERA